MSVEISKGLKVVQSVAPASLSGATNGTGVDTSGFNTCCVVVECGAIAATGTLDAKVQESATSGGTYTDITGATFTQMTDANDNATYFGFIKLPNNAAKPWKRVVLTQATASAVAGASLVLGRSMESGEKGTPAFRIV